MADGVKDEVVRLRSELDATRWALEDATKEIERLGSELRAQTEVYEMMIKQMVALGAVRLEGGND